MVQDALSEALGASGHEPVDELMDTAVLLASELCENAVLHAGTEFELSVLVTDSDITVAVTDRGNGPLEMHLAQPRARYGRAASHGRGLAMVQRLAAAWGTRHEKDGRHTVWFALTRSAAATETAPATPEPGPERVWTTAEQARWLLHIPTGLAARLQPGELVAELVRRLREVLHAASVSVEVDEGDGAHELARSGGSGTGRIVEMRLPMTSPLRGTLRVEHDAGADPVGADRERDLTELTANRVAMAVETRWLRGVDQRRRAWMAYLAETSELLGQSLDVDLTVNVVPQVVVPRLGRWCAVLLLDPVGRLRLAALSHADEERIPELRAVLDPAGSPGLPSELAAQLAELVGEDGSRPDLPARFATPTDGIALPMRARGTAVGTLIVGRPEARPHAPEDLVLAGDIARRAALAIQNAQHAAAHVEVSQALQHALLPRALPTAAGLDVAAVYLPASTGSDVGGDFYDVLTVHPRHWLVSIGDVCGKGARAAARTGQVRDVLRVLVREGHPLPEAVATLNEVLMEIADPLQFCTLAVAGVHRTPEPAPGLCVDLVLAGHLQPVLVRAGGGAELVGEFGTAVGLVPTVRVHRSTHRLAPGDTLLFYTDGVTERRRGREQFGPERLLAVSAEHAGRPAAQLVAAVREAVEGFSPDRLDDDVAIVAVRATH